MASPNYDRSRLFSAEGVVAVITGGGSGLGEYIAHALDVNGAKAVFILGRREAQLKRVAAAAKNGSITPIVADVTSKESLQRAAAEVRDKVGFVNVLFANAGITGPLVGSLVTDKEATVEQYQEKLWGVSMEDFTQTMHVNVTAAFYTGIAFLGLLDEGNKRANVVQKSQIITTASVAAFSRVPAAGFAYGASKAAIVHTTKQLATCFARFKIRVNAIAPGFYPSEMTENMPWMQGDDPRIEGALPSATVPLERVGSEEDIAGLALFLLSPAGAYMNGTINLTDGGRVGVFPGTY